MQIRWLLFVALAGGHLAVALAAPEAFAPAVAASVYLPLVPLSRVGVPVFSAAGSGGWPAPSMLGWTIAALVWLAVWWMAASLLSRMLPGRSRDA